MRAFKVDGTLIPRFGAYCVDALVFGGIVFAGGFLGLVLAELLPASQVLGVVLAGIVLGAGVFALGYFFVRDGLLRGSIGKRLCGLSVIDMASAEPCTWKQSAIRNGVLFFLQAVELFTLDADGRRLGDRAAGTLVLLSRQLNAYRSYLRHRAREEEGVT